MENQKKSLFLSLLVPASQEVPTLSARQDLEIIWGEDKLGKGAMIRGALERVRGEVMLFAGFEELSDIMPLFLERGADAVCEQKTSRLVAIKTALLKSIPLRYDDFRFDIEIATKLGKRKALIQKIALPSFEPNAPLDFTQRLQAFVAFARFSLIEDLYHQESHGLKILKSMKDARRFNEWMADTLRPHLGQRILEIGAGIGNLTKQFIPREFYVASDIDPYAIDYLKTYALGKPYLDACKIDADATEDFSLLRGKFDTVLMVNVLEHVRDENATLKNAYEVLRPGGKIVILVPQFPALYGSLDHVVGHRERYTRQKLHDDLARAGFEIETIFDFNRFSVPSWFVHARIFKRKQLARVQLKTLEVLMPLIRRVDPFIPWGGLSLIAVGKKK